MVPPANPSAGRRRRFTAISAAVVLGALPTLVSGQERLPLREEDAIRLRLEQQDAELNLLRARLNELEASTAGPVLPGGQFHPASHANHHAMDAILQRLETLERQGAAAGEKKADAPKPDAKAKAKEPEWQDVSNEKWTVTLGGHMQAEYVLWPNRDSNIVPNARAGSAANAALARNYFEFRRLRLLADGVGYGFYDFRIQIDIEPEGGDGVATPVTDIKDAYLTIKEVPGLGQVRFGNFFVPFGLEQVTNDTNNIFLERSIPTQGIFCADREVGVASYVHSDDENLTWTNGAFFDSISESLKERVDSNQGLRLSSRVTYLPYYDEPSNGRYLVHTGAGVLYTEDQDDLDRVRARPQTHEGPFLVDTGVFISPRKTTFNLEFAVVWGNFTVQSEAFLSDVNLQHSGHALISGGYVHGSWFLTGENRIFQRFGQHGAQFARNQPFTNFFMTNAGFGSGAVELKARFSNLNLSQLNAGQYNDFTFGVNWYWSDRTRVMVDWIHPFTSTGAYFGKTSSDLLGMRLDYNF